MIFDNHEENERQQDPTLYELESSRRTQRNCHLPSKYEDCVISNDNDPSDEEIINFALFAECELVIFEEATRWELEESDGWWDSCYREE